MPARSFGGALGRVDRDRSGWCPGRPDQGGRRSPGPSGCHRVDRRRPARVQHRRRSTCGRSSSTGCRSPPWSSWYDYAAAWPRDSSAGAVAAARRRRPLPDRGTVPTCGCRAPQARPLDLVGGGGQPHLRCRSSCCPTWWPACCGCAPDRRFTSGAAVASRCRFPGAWCASSCSAGRPTVGGGSVSSADVHDSPTNPGCMYFSARYARSDGLLGALHPVHAGPRRGSSGCRPGMGRPCTSGRPQLLDEGQATSDSSRPMPSLHAGCTLAVRAVRLARVRARLATPARAYPVLMAFSLIYSAEHYLIDVLAGWAMAVAVQLATDGWSGAQSAPAQSIRWWPRHRQLWSTSGPRPCNDGRRQPRQAARLCLPVERDYGGPDQPGITVHSASS